MTSGHTRPIIRNAIPYATPNANECTTPDEPWYAWYEANSSAAHNTASPRERNNKK